MIPKYKFAVLLLALAVVLPMSASAAQGGVLSVPVSGTINGAAISNGVFNITSFAVNGSQVVANGTLSFASTTGQQVLQLAVPVTAASGTCPVLSLTLGPLHLNLLGLVVDLNQINLNITAQSGPGNLLGNLLCAITNLLNNSGGLGNLVGGLLNQLATLLNQLLAAL
jgi:hypothetical protein